MQIDCPKCGKTFELTHAADQFTCPICGTFTSLNKADTLYLYTMPFAITDKRANDVFRKWAASPERIHDLLVKCTDKQWNKYYLPVGKIVRIVSGVEQVSIFSLSENNTVNPELRIDTIPPGELRFYDGEVLDAQAIMPVQDINKLLTEYMGKPKEQSVVFVPVYHLQYNYDGTQYSMLINGVTGAVYTDSFPKATDEIYKQCAKKYLYAGIGGGLIAGLLINLSIGPCPISAYFDNIYVIRVTPELILALVLIFATIIGVAYMSRKDGLVLLDELEKNRSYDDTQEEKS